MTDSTIMLLQVPVLHQGYLEFFRRHAVETRTLVIPSQTVLDEFEGLHPEIRAIAPGQMAEIIAQAGIIETVILAESNDLRSLLSSRRIITAQERICRRIIERWADGSKVVYDTAFLRWEAENVYTQSDVAYDRQVRETDDDYLYVQERMRQAHRLAGSSGDWWRQVGGVLVPDRHSPFTGYNQHVPNQLTPYADGDPRDSIPAGQDSEMATAFHAEASLIAVAARQGVSTMGARLFLTVFPCPACAKLIAYTGIRQLFFATGHASLDGETVLRSQNVELIYAPTK